MERPYRIEYRDVDGQWRYWAMSKTIYAAATLKVWERFYFGGRVIERSTGHVKIAWSGRGKGFWN